MKRNNKWNKLQLKIELQLQLHTLHSLIQIRIIHAVVLCQRE